MTRPNSRGGKRRMVDRYQCARRSDKRQTSYKIGANSKSQNKHWHNPLSKHYCAHMSLMLLWKKKKKQHHRISLKSSCLREHKQGWRISLHPIFHPGKERGQNRTLYFWRISNIWLLFGLSSGNGLQLKSTPSTAAAGLAERPSSLDTDKQSQQTNLKQG